MQRVEANADWSLFCPNEAPGLAEVRFRKHVRTILVYYCVIVPGHWAGSIITTNFSKVLRSIRISTRSHAMMPQVGRCLCLRLGCKGGSNRRLLAVDAGQSR